MKEEVRGKLKALGHMVLRLLHSGSNHKDCTALAVALAAEAERIAGAAFAEAYQAS